MRLFSRQSTISTPNIGASNTSEMLYYKHGYVWLPLVCVYRPFSREGVCTRSNDILDWNVLIFRFERCEQNDETNLTNGLIYIAMRANGCRFSDCSFVLILVE